MSLLLITGPANSGKARAVLDELRRHAAHGSEPLLVVPTGADVQRYRRELAEGGLATGVRVERFQGLLTEIARRAQVGGRALARPLTQLQREQLLRALLSESAARASEQGATERMSASGQVPSAGQVRALGQVPSAGQVRALARLVAELHAARVTPQRLHTALDAWAQTEGATRGRRAEQLTALFAGYQAQLERLARTDPDGRAVLALDELRRRPALWGHTPVLLYGFDDLTPLQLDAVETLARVVDAPVTVALAYEPGRVAFAGRAGAVQTLLPWASEHRRLAARADYYAPHARAALHQLERGLFEPERALLADGDAGIRLLEGGSPRAELELVAAQIGALLDDGMAPGDIVIVHRSPASIAELLTELLASFAIPYAASLRVPFAHTALGRALCGLLAAACGAQAGGSRPDRLEGSPAGRLEDLLAWLRAPGVIERPQLVDRLEARARRTGVSDAAGARRLWEAERWPLHELDDMLAAAQRGPLALIERVQHELQRLFCAPRRRAAEVLADAPGLEEAAALRCATHALEDLTELARAAPQLAPDAQELLAIMRGLEIDLLAADDPLRPNAYAAESRTADTQAPDLGMASEQSAAANAVTLLHPLALRARRVRALFLCGLQTGVFPAVPRPEAVLSEDERRSLAELSGLRISAPRQTLADERYLFYAAVSRPEELLALSWHTAQEDGQAATASLFIDDVCDLFPAQLRDARLCRRAGEASWPGTSWHGESPPHAPPALAPLRDERLLEELRAERLWSASALESYAGCPARWLVERLLRARPLDPDPEPLARGGLAHAALRDVFVGLRERYGSAQLTPVQLPAARELLLQALADHAAHFPLSVAPERIPGVRRRLQADLERYLEYAAQAENEAGPLEPTHLELSFGFPDEQPPLPPLDLGEGVRVRGRIDRIDIAANGEAVVYDYKGTQATPADRWLSDGSLQMAIYMRAAEQLLHADVVGGFYQPLSGRDLRARGVLSEQDAVQLACVGSDRRERAELQELVEQTLALARSAAHAADAGRLHGCPDTCAFGEGGCMYPAICRSER
jgi:RecB family exonuclease